MFLKFSLFRVDELFRNGLLFSPFILAEFKKYQGEWIHMLVDLYWRDNVKRSSRFRYISEGRLLSYFRKLDRYISGKRLHQIFWANFYFLGILQRGRCKMEFDLLSEWDVVWIIFLMYKTYELYYLHELLIIRIWV